MCANSNARRAVLFASAIAIGAWSLPASAQTIVVPGPLGVDGDVTANNINLGGTIRSNQFVVSRSQQVSVTGNTSGTASKSSDLGVKTFCALSEVYIAGEDNHSSDTGECIVSLDTTSGKWTLTANAGGETDQVKCTAYCLSLPIATASGQDEMPKPRRSRRQ